MAITFSVPFAVNSTAANTSQSLNIGTVAAGTTVLACAYWHDATAVNTVTGATVAFSGGSPVNLTAVDLPLRHSGSGMGDACQWFYLTNAAGGTNTTISITLQNGTGGSMYIAAAALSACSFEAFATVTNTASTQTYAPLTTTHANAAAFAYTVTSGGSFSPTAGFTAFDVPTPNWFNDIVHDTDVGAAGTKNVGGTSASGDNLAFAVSFYEGGTAYSLSGGAEALSVTATISDAGLLARTLSAEPVSVAAAVEEAALRVARTFAVDAFLVGPAVESSSSDMEVDALGATVGVAVEAAAVRAALNLAAAGFSVTGIVHDATLFPSFFANPSIAANTFLVATTVAAAGLKRSFTFLAETFSVQTVVGEAVPFPSFSRRVTLTLINNSLDPTPVANAVALKWLWWDFTAATWSMFATTLPKDSGTVETTDAAGEITVYLPTTALAAGQVGTLLITDSNGDANQTPAHRAFFGPVEVA